MTKIAVIQQPPVYLDLEKTMARAIGLIEDAAQEGAGMVVFPEAWFSGYPTFVWRMAPGAGMTKTDELFARLQASSIDLTRGGMAPLQEAAKEHGMVVVAGYQEIDGAVSGSTLYNSCIIIDADGEIANNHRKLMPTNPERMVWGFGDGSGLNVVDTAVGRIGALLCWENYMPLLRTTMYAKGTEIWCAPTVDARPVWQSTMQHIALEGRCFVASACQYQASPAEQGLDVDNWSKDTSLISGGSVIIDPLGNILAGPLLEKEGMISADINMDDITKARYDMDVVGHYARPDVFELRVNETPRQSVTTFIENED